MAVWAEGKLCVALLPLNTGNHWPNVAHTEPWKASGMSRPDAEDEHFQQIGRPARRQGTEQHPRHGPTPAGIELVKRQQHKRHPQPVPERLEHVQIAEIGVNGRCTRVCLSFQCLKRTAIGTSTPNAATAASSQNGGQEKTPAISARFGHASENWCWLERRMA